MPSRNKGSSITALHRCSPRRTSMTSAAIWKLLSLGNRFVRNVKRGGFGPAFFAYSGRRAPNLRGSCWRRRCCSCCSPIARDAAVPLAGRSERSGARADARKPAHARVRVHAGVRRRADARLCRLSRRERSARRRCRARRWPTRTRDGKPARRVPRWCARSTWPRARCSTRRSCAGFDPDGARADTDRVAARAAGRARAARTQLLPQVVGGPPRRRRCCSPTRSIPDGRR